MTNEYVWSDEELAERVARFCSAPLNSEDACALVWTMERLVLPNSNSYCAGDMKKCILAKFEEIENENNKSI